MAVNLFTPLGNPAPAPLSMPSSVMMLAVASNRIASHRVWDTALDPCHCWQLVAQTAQMSIGVARHSSSFAPFAPVPLVRIKWSRTVKVSLTISCAAVPP